MDPNDLESGCARMTSSLTSPPEAAPPADRATSSLLLSEVRVVDGNKGAKDSSSYSDSSSDISEEAERTAWGSKAEYVLSMVGYCVGLGNVWRFPYVCMRNGGGAFLIPFFICLTACGMPLYFLEVSLGQFVSLSPIHVWEICPLFKGIGYAMACVTFLFAWYYCMVLAWSLIYLMNSFKDPLPWTLCGQWWNSAACLTTDDRQGLAANASLSLANATAATVVSMATSASDVIADVTTSGAPLLGNATTLAVNVTRTSSSEEFWIRNVLRLSTGLSDFGGVEWHLGLALFAQALIVYLCLIKGIQTVGKVVYVTATLPYILITILLVKGLTLEGMQQGIIFYLKPDFSKVMLIETWVEASLQVFYSLGPAWGALITMASYNKFNNNCLRDSVILSFTCELTSVFAGFAIFSILGHMAYKLDVPVSSFKETGPGLAFIVYPEAISLLPLPQLWGVLFFVMLFTLGLDTQFASCETILTILSDLYPRLMKRKQFLIKLTYFVTLFLIGLPFCTKGGMYLFQWVDWYFAAYTPITIGFMELIVIGWIYGSDRFYDDIALMIGHRPPVIFAILWKFITPLFLGSVLISTLITYGSPKYMGYHFSGWEVVSGWILASFTVVPIPIYCVYKLIKTPGSLSQRISQTCKPSMKYFPAQPKLKEEYLETARQKNAFMFQSSCRCRSS